jgi:serine/threonine protein phosphatase 1
MLKNLFGTRNTQIVPPVAPADTRIYAIGDIHGRVDLLGRLHDLIKEDSANSPPARLVVIYLGDYVDRGETSKTVIDLLLDEPLEDFEAIFLKGNHEEMMLGFMENAGVGAMWLHNGGDATAYSYGVRMDSPSTMDHRYFEMQQALCEKVPDRHLAFLRNLDLYHTEGDYLFVHAGVQPGMPLEEQTSQDLLWIRHEFITSREDHGHCVVHGHTIFTEPEIRPNRIGIDTGAYYTNVLSCVVLEGTEQRLIQT